MPHSVLEAIKLGLWDYEPPPVGTEGYEATEAMPGTRQKLEALAQRVQQGLPLWHPSDRADWDEAPSGVRHRASDN